MKKMNYKKYKIYKIIIVILLTGIVSGFVTAGNFIIPLAVFLLAIIIMYLMNKNVDAKLTDERINAVAGKASRIVLSASALIMAAAGIVLIALREKNPQYLIIGNLLIFIECGMMLVYAILFKHYSKKKI
jgi:uncharacterized membrane protein